MSSDPNDKQLDETFDTNSLDVVIAEYIRACEAGQPPDRDEFLAKHPDLADELREFIANQDQMDEVARPVRKLRDSLHPIPQLGDSVHYFGDYELVEEIGRGGMGVIYKAKQVSLDRLVALKMILHGNVASPTDLERFRADFPRLRDLGDRVARWASGPTALPLLAGAWLLNGAVGQVQCVGLGELRASGDHDGHRAARRDGVEAVVDVIGARPE